MRYISLPGSNGDFVSTPDAAAFSALSDFSVAVYLSMNDWTPAATSFLMCHNGNRSWTLALATNGTLRLQLSNTDVAFQTQAFSTVAPTVSDGTAIWLLVTRETVAGNIKFYTAPSNAYAVPAIGSFTQLGTTVGGALALPLWDGTDTLVVGANGSAGTSTAAGKVYRSTLYSGVYGSGSEVILRDCNAFDGKRNTTTWVAATSAETWTLAGNAKILDDALQVPTWRPTAAIQRAAAW